MLLKTTHTQQQFQNLNSLPSDSTIRYGHGAWNKAKHYIGEFLHFSTTYSKSLDLRVTEFKIRALQAKGSSQALSLTQKDALLSMIEEVKNFKNTRAIHLARAATDYLKKPLSERKKTNFAEFLHNFPQQEIPVPHADRLTKAEKATQGVLYNMLANIYIDTCLCVGLLFDNFCPSLSYSFLLSYETIVGVISFHAVLGTILAAMPYAIGVIEGAINAAKSPGENKSFSQAFHNIHAEGLKSWNAAVKDENSFHPIIEGFFISSYLTLSWALLNTHLFQNPAFKHIFGGKIFHTGFYAAFDTIHRFKTSCQTEKSWKETFQSMGSGLTSGLFRGSIKDYLKVDPRNLNHAYVHSLIITVWACICRDLASIFIEIPKNILFPQNPQKEKLA